MNPIAKTVTLSKLARLVQTVGRRTKQANLPSTPIGRLDGLPPIENYLNEDGTIGRNLRPQTLDNWFPKPRPNQLPQQSVFNLSPKTIRNPNRNPYMYRNWNSFLTDMVKPDSQNWKYPTRSDAIHRFLFGVPTRETMAGDTESQENYKVNRMWSERIYPTLYDKCYNEKRMDDIADMYNNIAEQDGYPVLPSVEDIQRGWLLGKAIPPIYKQYRQNYDQIYDIWQILDDNYQHILDDEKEQARQYFGEYGENYKSSPYYKRFGSRKGWFKNQGNNRRKALMKAYIDQSPIGKAYKYFPSKATFIPYWGYRLLPQLWQGNR